MRIALCQLNSTVGDLTGNTARMIRWYDRSVSFGAELVAFPELALTGYPPRDLVELPDFLEAAERAKGTLAGHTGATGLVFGTVLESRLPAGKRLVNGAILASEGKVRYEIIKKLLPTYDVFDEGRYFQPDPAPARPVEFRGRRIGLHICEDAWNEEAFWERRLYGRDPVEELAQHGADFMLNISASPFQGERGPFRRAMFASHVANTRRPFLYTNLIGGNDELIFDGEAFAFDAGGALVAVGTPFVEEILLVDVEDAGLRFSGSWSPGDEGVRDKERPLDLEPIETIHRALVLGLRDYAAKCGFEKVVLGLSGGIDSAVTAALAAEALAPDAVWGISLPGPYSSEHSLEDARFLAGNLCLRYDVLSIEPLFEGALGSLSETFRGTEPGVAEENLQARARGNLLMALSNKFGHLLLTTGNKSEMATGYCTLYGDMAGGLAVISDVPKTTVYDLAHWINRRGEVIPERSITKPPSAELRPRQTDQDTLPEYALLDRILEGYIEESRGEEDLVAEGLPRETVERVIRLVSRAEYKRRQAPPGLRISPKAFGTGRRMPIATPWPETSAKLP